MTLYPENFKDDKVEKFLNVAKAVSEFSPDEQTKVGAILVCNESKNILGVGYNGFIRKHSGDLPTTRPGKYEYMLHAEMNTIFNCARKGVSLDNTTLFVTLSPCVNCCRALFQCGVNTVYFSTRHVSFDTTEKAKDFNFTLTRGINYYKIQRI